MFQSAAAGSSGMSRPALRSAPMAQNADWYRYAESLFGGLFTPDYGSDPASVAPPYWRHMPVSVVDDALCRLIDSADLLHAAGRSCRRPVGSL